MTGDGGKATLESTIDAKIAEIMKRNKMKRLILWICVFTAFNSFASAWFKDKIVQDKNADVSVTIMRWGVPDDDLSTKTEDKKDRFVGQVASDK